MRQVLLTEHPRFSQAVALYARRQGHYDRPIVGAMVDLRFEDMGGLAELAMSTRIPNLIARLPDIAEAKQRGQYLIFNYGWLDHIETSQPKLQQLLATNKYLLLPDSPQSDLWQYTKAPWWEFAEVIDEHDGYIKAPRHPRGEEPSPDDIDERLDEFTENQGRLQVLSPLTLEKMLAGAVTESYVRKLARL